MSVTQIDVAELDKMDFVPQAIFKLAPSYFTMHSGCSFSDHLDHGLGSGEAAVFELDTGEKFALARYQGHPQHTTTLYLDGKVKDLSTITALSSAIMKEFGLVHRYFEWRRKDGPHL